MERRKIGKCMIKNLLFILFLFVSNNVFASCSTPSSSFTYVSGTVINPTAVQTNENNLYTYLQQGVCNYSANSITQSAVSPTAGILYSQLNLSGGILPGDVNTSATTNIYTFGGITVPNNITLNGQIITNGTSGNPGQVLVSQGGGPTVWGYPSGQLGTWSANTTYPATSVYHATTDGWFSSNCTRTGGGMTLVALTDSSSTPSTARNQDTCSAMQPCSVSSFVKKGDYWEITTTAALDSNNCVYFIPLGS